MPTSPVVPSGTAPSADSSDSAQSSISGSPCASASCAHLLRRAREARVVDEVERLGLRADLPLHVLQIDVPARAHPVEARHGARVHQRLHLHAVVVGGHQHLALVQPQHLHREPDGVPREVEVAHVAATQNGWKRGRSRPAPAACSARAWAGTERTASGSSVTSSIAPPPPSPPGPTGTSPRTAPGPKAVSLKTKSQVCAPDLVRPVALPHHVRPQEVELASARARCSPQHLLHQELARAALLERLVVAGLEQEVAPAVGRAPYWKATAPAVQRAGSRATAAPRRPRPAPAPCRSRASLASCAIAVPRSPFQPLCSSAKPSSSLPSSSRPPSTRSNVDLALLLQLLAPPPAVGLELGLQRGLVAPRCVAGSGM